MSAPPKVFGIDVRYVPPMLITCILLVGQVSFGLLESFSRTTLAIAAALATELILSRLLTGKYANLASAYISGISVGILLRAFDYWPYALCSAIAITSKYVVRWRGRHLWNPTNFAIVAMLILAPDYISTLSIQWGNTVWPMLVIWVLGAIIVYRVKRLHITGVYVVSFIALAFLRSLITGHPFFAEVAPITGPMYQLFIFFMITDPKTTVKPRWGQCLVAFLIAVVEMGLRLEQSIYAAFYALAIVGPIANVIEIWWTSRAKVAPPQRVAAMA
jgi:Na+-translocating ferredoxin:NAD+ oxidoreductase RnfD subunit